VARVAEKSVYVRDIREGLQVDSPFVIDAAELREKRGGKYILLTLSDRTGRQICRVWGTPESDAAAIEALYRTIRTGEIYRIRGYAKIFNGNCEINVNDGISHLLNPVPLSDVNIDDYIYAPVDCAGVAAALRRVIGSIEDDGIRRLTASAVSEAEGFFEVPAAVFRHHDYVGGLAEHTLETVRLACACADTVARTAMNRDVLVGGAVLHDIGKALCFRRQGISFAVLPDYDLIGHTTVGMNLLSRYRGFTDPASFAHILHIVQSHHGPHGEVAPRTAEAWAVHLADRASALLREVSDDVAELASGEGRKKGSRSGEPVYRF